MPADFDPNDPRSVWQDESAEVPRMSPAMLQEKLARINADSAKRRHATNVGLTFNVVLFLMLAFVFSHPVLRIGSGLTSIGWFIALRQLRRRDAAGMRAAATQYATSIQSYRSILERERDVAAAWPWLLAAVPGPIVYIIGTSLQFPRFRAYLYIFLAVLAALVAVIVATQLLRTRRYQRELDSVAGSWEDDR
jgi:SNF family Na+-dependent transporter